jgi:hypothetical protein
MQDLYKTSEEYSSFYIRDYSYKHGKTIYDFMNRYNVGRSTYGKMMDAAAKGKKVMAHRLYGHHLIYDFPLSDTKNIPAFLEHELSDLFTKMGLPIIPGEMLENTQLLKYCKSLTKNWNFVNGFDVLSGTIAVWQGIEKVNDTFIKGYSIDNFEDLANTIGVGAIELALALSTANPFLLIAATLHLTSGLKGIINDGSVILFRKNINSLLLEFSLNCLNISAYLKMNNINSQIKSMSIESSLNKMRINS